MQILLDLFAERVLEAPIVATEVTAQLRIGRLGTVREARSTLTEGPRQVVQGTIAVNHRPRRGVAVEPMTRPSTAC
jgi:hypothetical protein